MNLNGLFGVPKSIDLIKYNKKILKNKNFYAKPY